MKKSKRGGARPGAGAPKGSNSKPDEEKKVQFPLYVQGKKLNALGRDRCREIAEEAIDKEYELARVKGK